MMTKSKPFWFLRNWQAWVVLGMGVVTAIVIKDYWIISLGVIGYLTVLLFETGGGSGDKVAYDRTKQENRTLSAEHNRLVGQIKELEAKNAQLEKELAALKSTAGKPKN